MNSLPTEVVHCILDVLEPAPRPLRLAHLSKRWAAICAAWRPRTLPVADVIWSPQLSALVDRSKSMCGADPSVRVTPRGSSHSM